MTYCVAIRVADGLVFASDSRTNAGADQISTYSKMHRIEGLPRPPLAALETARVARIA